MLLGLGFTGVALLLHQYRRRVNNFESEFDGLKKVQKS
jgi:hypothetical protein